MEKYREVHQRYVSNSVAIEATNHFINKHQNFYEELQGDAQGLKDATKKTLTTFSDDREELKEQTRWKHENESILHEILRVATTENTTLEDTSEQNERMIKMEISIRNAIVDADMHELWDYLDHLSNVHLWLNRA